jgi:hypothetical protein
MGTGIGLRMGTGVQIGIEMELGVRLRMAMAVEVMRLEVVGESSIIADAAVCDAELKEEASKGSRSRRISTDEGAASRELRAPNQ